MSLSERAKRVGANEHDACDSGERGFTLLETVVAFVLMMIVALGAASVFAYSVYNNTGASERSVELAIAQQTLEIKRNAKFGPSGTDAALLAGTFTQTGVVRNGRTYTVKVVIDDDPSTPAVDVNAATTLKKITVTVTTESGGTGWASGGWGSVTLITERAKSEL